MSKKKKELFELNSNAWNHLTVYKKWTLPLLKILIQIIRLQIITICCILICRCMHDHNEDTIKKNDTVLWKIYLLLYLKGLCVRGSWRRNRIATYWPPTLMAISVSFPFAWAAQPGAKPLWVLVFSTTSYLQLVWSIKRSIGGLRAPSTGCWLSVRHLVSNWSSLQTDWIYCALSYIIVHRPLKLLP